MPVCEARAYSRRSEPAATATSVTTEASGPLACQRPARSTAMSRASSIGSSVSLTEQPAARVRSPAELG